MKFLVIQTAFIGDAILATPVLEKLHQHYPDGHIDLLVRRGNETLFQGHPFVRQVLVWHKKERKYQNLWQLLRRIRRQRYDWIINLQRFGASGFLTAAGGARQTVGFVKNPFASFFTKKINHTIDPSQGIHEVDRNLSLIHHLTDSATIRPKLYPPNALPKLPGAKERYVCLAPTSVWFTKQMPAERWSALIRALPSDLTVYLLGAPGDKATCEKIRTASDRAEVYNLCGSLTLLESAALMREATMNYVNDSAPLHLASSVNAPVTAVFCSTVPGFGFTPLSEKSYVVETRENLSCRPCGLHGKRACPEGHFKCGDIAVEDLLGGLR